MSKFNIYISKKENIKAVGKKSRKAALFYAIILPFNAFPFILLKTISFPLNYILVSLDIVILIGLVVYSYYNSKKLIIAGGLEFYKTGAIKIINDSKEIWDFKLLEKLILKVHTKTSNGTKKTYLLTALFDDKRSQQIVVGNFSIGKPEKTLEEIVKLSSKINKFELEIM